MDTALDRLPPHNLDAEQSVLGSLLIDRDAIISVASNLRASDFYYHYNGLIFQAVLDLYNRQEPTDVVTLRAELERRGALDEIGGDTYLSSLVSGTFTSVHVEYYADIVERESTRRKLINAGTKIVGFGYQDELEVREAVDRSESALHDVLRDRGTRDFKTMAEVLDEIFNNFDTNRDPDDVVGVPTGFAMLDQMTGGLQRSDLIIIAARPSVGKSAFALSIAYNAAVQHDFKVGMFSLEMSADQLVLRLLATETGIDAHMLRLGRINNTDWTRVSRALGTLSNAEIYIDDGAAASIMDVRSKARRLQAEHGLDLIIIDYLQLMQGRRTESRVLEISEISRGLKGLARELNIPVIALSQLSRAVEQRKDHIPMLSDLRESGSIEQDADIVMFIHREDRFDPESTKKGIADIIIAKHRNGPVGTVSLHFVEKTARFGDLNTHAGEPEW